jgi:hypothetical protein
MGPRSLKPEVVFSRLASRTHHASEAFNGGLAGLATDAFTYNFLENGRQLKITFEVFGAPRQ